LGRSLFFNGITADTLLYEADVSGIPSPQDEIPSLRVHVEVTEGLIIPSDVTTVPLISSVNIPLIFRWCSIGIFILFSEHVGFCQGLPDSGNFSERFSAASIESESVSFPKGTPFFIRRGITDHLCFSRNPRLNRNRNHKRRHPPPVSFRR